MRQKWTSSNAPIGGPQRLTVCDPRGVQSELMAALGPVVRDLSDGSGILPEIRDEPWADRPEAASCMLVGPDESGAGVWIELGQPVWEQVAALADPVQDWVVKALWAQGRSASWPPCPRHPRGHPAKAISRDRRALWVRHRRHSEVWVS